MYSNNDMFFLRKKFFEKQNTFQNFTNITEEDLNTLKKAAQDFTSNFSTTNSSLTKVFLYEKVLRKVNTYQNNPDYYNFDRQIIFVIYALDPDLLMYKIFLATPNNPKSTITNSENNTNYLNTLKDNLLKYVGLTDNLLLKYEEIFFKQFFKNKILIKGVKKNILPNLTNRSKLITNFDLISEERFTTLSQIATKWLDENIYDDFQTKLYTALYNILYQSKLLGIAGIQEQFCLFILLIDPELEMLSIYEEESRIPNIKNRITERFTFYHQDLIRLEKIYHKKFVADLQVSPWLF